MRLRAAGLGSVRGVVLGREKGVGVGCDLTRNEPQIAPTLNIGLPERWFVTLYPSYDIRINYGDPVPGQTGRLFLPFDAAIGRKITDKAMITWEIAAPIVKDYPVYNFKTELRLTINF